MVRLEPWLIEKINNPKDGMEEFNSTPSHLLFKTKISRGYPIKESETRI